MALGLGNVVGSFFSSYPVTGSFSRTALNFMTGVMTPLGGLFTSAIVMLGLRLELLSYLGNRDRCTIDDLNLIQYIFDALISFIELLIVQLNCFFV